jgi:large subunit ribosomal protein L3
MMRAGLVAEKIGMTRIFNEQGDHIPVTVLHVEACRVLAHKNQSTHGYDAVQIGFGKGRLKSLNKAQKGFYAKQGVEAHKGLKEFRVSEDGFLEVGTVLHVEHFEVGQYVDVIGVSLGKGFAGVMKRHNFKGMRATHGVSVSHRAHGSTGQCQDPGRVFKGKKMAGHLGAEQVTIQNLKVVKLDSDKGLIYLRGAVPGHKKSVVTVSDAIKRK